MPFKKGGFHLAIKYGCYIVPVAIYGSHDIMHTNGPIKSKKTIMMEIGKPISSADYSTKNMREFIIRGRDAVIKQMTSLSGAKK